jgi:uncharacterized protein YrrD
MLRLSKSYYNQHVLSLRTGGKIGVAREPIINPNNLKIEGWYCSQNYENGEFILPIGEVRDIIAKGIVVNDHDSLTAPEDMIRLKKIVDLHFQLQGKIVKTEAKTKLGKVADYAVDDESTFVQKLYVNPSLLRGITENQLVIDRTAIVEITDREVIVKETTVPVGSTAPVPMQA